MRGRSRLVSVVMIAVMLTFSISAAQAFAGIPGKHAATHVTNVPCPCPDKSDCPSESCDDVGTCLASCLSVFSIELYAAAGIETQHSRYPDAVVIQSGDTNQPPPLPPPTA